MSYMIKRFFFSGESEVVAEGLTLEEAKEHCQSKEASSVSCVSEEACKVTKDRGPWFDGFEEE